MPSSAARPPRAGSTCVGRVRVVAGRHRRVRGEHGRAADGGERVVGRGAGGHDRRRAALDRRERGVALVEVETRRARCRARAARARRRRRARRTARSRVLAVADVQPRVIQRVDRRRCPRGRCRAGRAAPGRRRRARRARAPRASPIGTLDRRAARPSSALTSDRGQPLGIGRRSSTRAASPRRRCAGGSSPARYISPTPTSGSARSDASFSDVAGEHAEAAAVDRQRAVDAELGAEERDRALRVHRSVRVRALEIRPQPRTRARPRAPPGRRPRRRAQRARGSLLEQPHRVAPAALPALGSTEANTAWPSGSQHQR